jgi:hypothetical protein
MAANTAIKGSVTSRTAYATTSGALTFLWASGDRVGLGPLLANGVGEAGIAHSHPQKNKEASADHRPKEAAASHA